MSGSVTALVVTYNHERYIEGAIASALAQGPMVSEVIVIDDGSSDATAGRVQAIADSRVRLLHGTRRGLAGLAETYNAGVAASRGDYLAILEGDDLWPTGKLARQLRAFEDPAVVVAHGDYSVIGAHGTVLRPRVALSRPPGAYDALAAHLVGSYVMSVTAVIRRAAIVGAGGFTQLTGTPHWDHPTFLALAERGLFHHSAEVVGTWRKHGRSGTIMLAGADTDATEFSCSLALATRRRLKEREGLPSEHEIRLAWSEAFARNAFQVGRVLLVGRRYGEARALAFRGLARARKIRTRLGLGAVLLASIARADVERFMKRGGHSTIEELG